MNIYVKILTNPESIEMYKNSNYTDERHFAVSQLLEAAEGLTYDNQEDFKKSIFRNVFEHCRSNLIPERIFGDEEEPTFIMIEEDFWEAYKILIYYLFKKLPDSDKILNEDLLDVAYSTSLTEKYIMDLVDEYVECI